MYSLARKLLFSLNPESSHDLSLDCLGAAERLGLLSLVSHPPQGLEKEVMGLKFPNPIGLAAGLDKNGDYFNALGKLGFGFVEIGTVTPKAQPGNPLPRLFRLIEQEAIINRMGFNNKGVAYLAKRAKRRRYQGILGINIGKNKSTPEKLALNDYLACMDVVYPLADYITVNISSPNTPGLRNLQFGEALDLLLEGVKERQHQLYRRYQRYVPIAVKIAPDMNKGEIQTIANTFLKMQMDGVIATNTTLGRDGVESSPFAEETGGLSGKPLLTRSTEVLGNMVAALGGKIPVIGVGGISSGEDALAKLQAGAELVQIYSGFIYKGPALIKEAASALALAHTK